VTFPTILPSTRMLRATGILCYSQLTVLQYVECDYYLWESYVVEINPRRCLYMLSTFHKY